MNEERDYSKFRNVTYDYSSMKLSTPRTKGIYIMPKSRLVGMAFKKEALNYSENLGRQSLSNGQSGAFVSSVYDAAAQNKAEEESDSLSILDLLS